MDLNGIREVCRPRRPEDIPSWEPGFSWLAGGTWLFSEPQPTLHTLIDLESFGWSALTVTAAGIEIAATCKVVELDRLAETLPAEWLARPLLGQCCRAFLASFKIWNEATVGGNIVMSLPAGPMISLTAALEGIGTFWPRDGEPRQLPIAEFVTGNHANLLAPGELLRSVFLPASALRKTYAFRRFEHTQQGRSEALLVGTVCPESAAFRLTITAATDRPRVLEFAAVPTSQELRSSLDAEVPPEAFFDDPFGSADHRRHLAYYFAEQIRAELQ